MPTYTIPKQELIFLNNTDGKNVRNYVNKKDSNHRIIRYIKDKLKSPEDFSMYGKYRSVVANKDNYVVAFSPPKSILFNEFIEKNEFKDIVVEELIEGTMINLFYDSYKKDLEIATRSNIGGNNKFVQEHDIASFRDMFLEACVELKFDFEKLPKSSDTPNSVYSYSFVMQHPKNRIVSRTDNNKCWIYLIEMYEIIHTDTGSDINRIDNEKYMELFSSLGISVSPELLLNNTITSYDEVIKHATMKDSWCGKTYMCFGGFMIKNKITNERTKLRDTHYEHIRKLRGNQIKPKYHYLALRKLRKLQEYLQYYPEDKNKYDVYRQELSDYVYNLWRSYIGCYIKKEKPVKEWPRQFRVHMFNIHNEFIHNREVITLNKVYIYFNKLHESQQMFLLNYKESYDNKNDNDTEIVEEIVEDIVNEVSIV